MKPIDWEKERKKREEAQAAQARKEEKELRKFVPSIPIPAGFVGAWELTNWSSQPVFVLRNEAENIRLIFKPWGSGTTEFKVEKADKSYWASYDRTGVEDSFYWKSLYQGHEVDIEKTIEEQLARIKKTREFHKTSLTVPDVGHSVSPEGLLKLKEELRTQGYVRFYPSGFGTGYIVMTKFRKHTTPGSKALNDFFGLGQLHVDKFDCD